MTLVPLAPQSPVAVYLTPTQYQEIYEDVDYSVRSTIPSEIQRDLRPSWVFNFTPWPSDLLPPQTALCLTDKDDKRTHQDQVGGACFADSQMAYVAAFRATDAELTDPTRYSTAELAGIARHEIAHAFDAFLKRFVEGKPGAFFSEASVSFSNALLADTLAAGGTEALREDGFSYYTPGEKRKNRHLVEVFAEGTAILWGGGCRANAREFQNKYPRCMSILRDIQKEYLAVDWTNEARRIQFQNFIESHLDEPDTVGHLAHSVQKLAQVARTSLPKLCTFRDELLSQGNGYLFEHANHSVAQLCQFFLRYLTLSRHNDEPRFERFYEDYRELYDLVHTQSYNLFPYRRMREIQHEMTAAFAPKLLVEAALKHASERIEIDFGRTNDPVLAHYLRLTDAFVPKGWKDRMEWLLLTRRVEAYGQDPQGPMSKAICGEISTMAFSMKSEPLPFGPGVKNGLEGLQRAARDMENLRMQQAYEATRGAKGDPRKTGSVRWPTKAVAQAPQ